MVVGVCSCVTAAWFFVELMHRLCSGIDGTMETCEERNFNGGASVESLWILITLSAGLAACRETTQARQAACDDLACSIASCC